MDKMEQNINIPATKEDVLQIIKDRKISFIQMWFHDVLGLLKSFSIYKTQVEEAIEEGMGFDGSSIEGFVRIEESDLVAKADPTTFRILPYRPQDIDGVGMFFCDILNPDGTPFAGDSMNVLRKQEERAKKLGFDAFYVGPELEFFLFKDNNPENLQEKLLDHGGYFGVADDAGREVRRDIIRYCQLMGIPVEYSHHEVAFSQHEIDLEYASGLQMARRAKTYRRLVKEVAKQKGVYASFMPKPIFGINGSGMHVHQSLFNNGENAFFDKDDKFHLSKTGKHYLAGILKHAKEICAITNQWVNSFQRLVPGYEAPTEISWGRKNRSALVRVPMYKPGKEKATRIEVRFPDPACNISLAFAVMLGAGLEGIENEYELVDPIERNIYEIPPEERIGLKIEILPGSLEEATAIMKSSKLLKKILGEHIFSSIIANQEYEWEQYYLEATGRERLEHRVTKYELRTLFPRL